MAPRNMVERTAKEPFRLNDEPIARGRVVTLNPGQLKTLAASNCVALTDEENDAVAKGDLPPLQAAPGLIDAREIESRMTDARRAAGEELERLQQNIAEARTKAEAEITAQGQRSDAAKAKADSEVAGHETRAAEAKAKADAAVAEAEKRAAAAKTDKPTA